MMTLAATIGVLALGLSAPPARAEGSNDNFASATLVDAMPFEIKGDTTSATLEGGEPQPSCSQTETSVWYRLDQTEALRVNATTVGSSFDTVLAVYRGTSFADLREVACNDDGAGLMAQTSFKTLAGQSYFIQLSGFGTAAGPFSLALSATRTVLDNDAFAKAAALTGSSFTLAGDGAGKTLEAGEPTVGCGYPIIASSWYRFTATERTAIFAGTQAEHTITVAYRGTSLADLTAVSCNHDTADRNVRVPVAAGETVYIQVAFHDWDGDGRPFELTGGTYEAPVNDEATGALPISFGEDSAGTNVNASDSAGEPICAGGYGGVWYRFVAPETQSYVASTSGSALDTTVGVFTGSPSELQMTACSDQTAVFWNSSSTGFSAVAGETYFIKVAGWWGDVGSFNLRVLEGVAYDAGLAGAVVASDDDDLEVAVGADALFAGAGVYHHEDADSSETDACLYAVIFICV
ncbi:MAG TPA: hypothetical protein VMY34_02110 [Acidimicrobiales bacterium]|nr:hypothetical protein [Acidimicrobiales bacterium]